MKDPRTIVLRPIVTERANRLREEQNKYSFQVEVGANKIEIKRAVEELFKVRVTRVTTQNQLGKVRRLGRFEGKRPDWKKAVCTLKEGDRIEVFEGT